MKPKKISINQYYEIDAALTNKAFRLARFYNGPAFAGPSDFYSDAGMPCKYHARYEDEIPPEPPATFRRQQRDPYAVASHFMPIPCGCKSVNMNVDTICLYITQDGNPYLTTHKVGRCPWKKVPTKA